MDAVLICGSNVLFENFAAFAVFGVVGFLRRWPTDGVRLGAFVVGFLTLPEAVLQMPGQNFWAFLLFFTLIVLGFSSAFVMLDVVATLLVDGGVKYSRPTIVTFLTLLSFLMCIPYCTQFGYYLLDGIDRWINNVMLIFVVWAECVTSTSVYRYSDIIDQTGTPAFAVYNSGYLGGQLVGIVVAHTTDSPGIGAGVGIGIWVLGSVVAVLMAKMTEVAQAGAPKAFRANKYLAKFYYLAFYSVSLPNSPNVPSLRPSHMFTSVTLFISQSTADPQGNQLRRDLNVIVGQKPNWRIPFFMPFLLRYISGPILAIIFSFAFPEFHTLRYDPMMVAGFILSLLGVSIVLFGFVAPRYYGAFIPAHRKMEGKEETVINEDKVDSIVLEEGAKEAEVLGKRSEVVA